MLTPKRNKPVMANLTASEYSEVQDLVQQYRTRYASPNMSQSEVVRDLILHGIQSRERW